MRTQRLAVAVTVINFGLLLCVFVWGAPTSASDVAPVVRAQVIELVDKKGQVRAQLKVEESGEAVFRIRDSQGTIRVKLGGSEKGSGLVLLNDSTEPGVHILAGSEGTSLKLVDKTGRQKIVSP